MSDPDPSELKFFSIARRWSREEIYRCQARSFREAVETAVRENANLAGANLADADLTDADLTDADLTRANLAGANLTRADLTRADLTRANLARANLARANLTRADLTRANLTRADLTDANLADANLADANLADAREDLLSILDLTPREVPALRAALVAGKVDGSVYEGDCACLVGTIANAIGCGYTAVPGVAPDGDRPAERLFLAIAPGGTPEVNPVARLVVNWIDEWTAGGR